MQEAFLERLALPAKTEKTAHLVNADLKAIEETEAMRELEDLLDNPVTPVHLGQLERKSLDKLSQDRRVCQALPVSLGFQGHLVNVV